MHTSARWRGGGRIDKLEGVRIADQGLGDQRKEVVHMGGLALPIKLDCLPSKDQPTVGY